jgi:hypothetical protein
MSKFDGSIGSKILDEGMTPAKWIVVLAEMDIIISERTLREKARETRATFQINHTLEANLRSGPAEAMSGARPWIVH